MHSLTILGRRNESAEQQKTCGPGSRAMSGDQSVEERVRPRTERNRQRFDVRILGESCVGLLVEQLRETYRRNDSEIHAGVLVGKEVHQNGAGPMNNSVMIALKIGQYNETCR